MGDFLVLFLIPFKQGASFVLFYLSRGLGREVCFFPAFSHSL